LSLVFFERFHWGKIPSKEGASLLRSGILYDFQEQV
jgi:hypothetical protein